MTRYLCHPPNLLFQEKEDEIKDKLGELKGEHDEIIKQENTIKASKIEIDQEIEKHDDIIKENKAKMSHWKKKVIANCIEL